MTPRGQRFRLGFLVTMVGMAFSGVAGKLIWLHTLGPYDDLRVDIAEHRRFETETKGARGRVVDRNGRIMALDLGRANVAVDPSYLAQKNTNVMDVCKFLSGHLQMDLAMVKNQLLVSDKKYTMLKRAVPVDVAEQIRDRNIKGVILENVTKRYYPHKNLMSHVVGFSNFHGDGSLGIEQTMDEYLKGKTGLRIGVKDGLRSEVYGHREMEIEAKPGNNVVLTIDQYLQYHVEQELSRAITNFNAKGAWAIIMETRTGDILAMGSKPDFDLNEYGRTGGELMRNQAISYLYEPGSAVKPLIFAAALNEGLVDPNEEIDCEGGAWRYANATLHDYHGYDLLTAADVLKKSSNIGTAKIALRLGDDLANRYLRQFGMGAKTGIMLPGEQQGIFRQPDRWQKISLTRLAIGHEMSQTSLQVLCAINTIANNGFRVKPQIIRRIADNDGNVIHEFHPQVIDQPIRREVAQHVQFLMGRITDKGGTGWRAAMDHYKVAGKTGTAEKVINGRYDRRKNIASFVGFLPAENPQITMIVAIDEPTTHRTGGVTAAPVFKRIAERAVRILNVPPSPPQEATDRATL
jgi:cell division protein FtsI (penicillin-binding protein 3)